MKKNDLALNYYVHSLSTHHEIKNILLESIENFVKNNNYGTVSNTDWNISEEIQREWFNIFINKNIDEISEIYKNIFSGIDINKKIEIVNWWFQQYEKDSYHSWHNHPNVSFSNVYYLELPSEKETTEFFSDNGNFFAEAKEGDLVIFPGYIPHRAINKSDDRRTVLVFNSILYIDDIIQ